MKRWTINYDACVDCGRTSVVHQAKGRCSACYTKYKWKTSAKRRKQMLEASKKWRQNNKAKWNAICAKAQKKFKAKSQ
jgi:hypothetical protein